jgi:hypothetical protein
VPAVDGASNAESLGVDPAGFEHGVRYGGRQATRFNSSLVDDDEADPGPNGTTSAIVSQRSRPRTWDRT